jgi:hypothetical protein
MRHSAIAKGTLSGDFPCKFNRDPVHGPAVGRKAGEYGSPPGRDGYGAMCATPTHSEIMPALGSCDNRWFSAAVACYRIATARRSGKM